MYSKEEIVAEIRRVAAYLKVDTLTPAQFQDCSTIPLNTVEFFMGSWKAALLEARLSGAIKKEPTSKELLFELWRVYELTGEIPTYAQIDTYGQYPSSNYQKQWRSLEVPFKLAQRYYGVKKEDTSVDGYITDVGRTRMYSGASSVESKQPGLKTSDHDSNEDSQELDAMLAATVLSAPVPEFAAPAVVDGKSELDSSDEKEPAEEELDRTLASWPDEGGDVGDPLLPDYHIEIHDSQKPVIIPDLTPEPPLEGRLKGERFHFRGMQFPPADRVGVVFLFGMVANELGFFLETVGEGSGFNGFRTHRLDETEWSPVRLLFVHHSAELIDKKDEIAVYTHLVCWEHDWSQCPLPVLALSVLIQELPNYKRPA